MESSKNNNLIADLYISLWRETINRQLKIHLSSRGVLGEEK